MYDLTSRPRTLGHMVVAVTLCVPVSLSRDKHYVFPHQVPSPEDQGQYPIRLESPTLGMMGLLKCCIPHRFLRLAEDARIKQTLEIVGLNWNPWLCHHSPAP